ncbi:MAG: ferritin-like domain-containing protein [Actinomycetota bacterium]|nr:ferritin-like domain-containing protein [Actinomycetota bacterium]
MKRDRRGEASLVLAPELPPRGRPLDLRQGRLHTSDLISSQAESIPLVADPARGLIPLGAVAEAGGPQFDWRLNSRDEVWSEDLADLTERASELQWDATKDIPWEAALGLPDDIERAVAQVMTYIAANEYVALYVPAKFLPQVNPAFADVLMWLSGHVHDEARHVEVFTKRALLGGDRGYSLASTQLSLHSLLEEDDFSSASLLLNVLGEGTFLDLLAFIARTGPDEATRVAAKLAHRDEQRHVHFGISHVRRRMKLDPSVAEQLKAAVEARAAKLTSLTGLSPLLMESLTLMAAGSTGARELSEGAAQVRELTRQMETNRIRRLKAAGFDTRTAQHLSDLHTPNLM